MTVTLVITLVGVVLLGVIGFVGKMARPASLAEWTVAGRNFGAVTTWFLQAGEIFTTFTFLGVAGLAFTGGASGVYAIVYGSVAFAVLYFVTPRLWKLGKLHGYLTQADYFVERYDSPGFGKLVAALGVIFLVPYLQLQITGLGLIVKLVTGDASSSVISMIVATALTVGFVLWSGIRGIARTAYVKDALMIVAVVVVGVAIPLHYAGGIGTTFARIAAKEPVPLSVHTGQFNQVWWLTSILISIIGSGFMTTPHIWPSVLAARNPRVLRQNNIYLPLYQLVIILPLVVGFTGTLVLRKGADSNSVLLTLASGSLPHWVTGIVAVAGAAAAMVPAGTMCIGISTLVSHNLVRPASPRVGFVVNHGVVVVVAGLALVFGILRPDLLANLLLLTLSGLAQMAPALVAVLGRRRLLSKLPAMLGVIVGEVVVVWFTFGGIDIARINTGIIALAVNVGVAALAELVARQLRSAKRSGVLAEATVNG
jgi:SSS family solute:Na+ symporter